MLRPRGKWVLLAIIVATVASAFWIRESAPSYQKCQSQYESDRQAKKQKENSASFVVYRVLAYRCTNRLIESHKDAIVAVATVLLTIVTGFLVWVGYRQITTTRAQLRAYVVVRGKNCDTRPRRFISTVEIVNTGQTPARNLKVISATGILLHPPPKDFDFSLVDPGNPSVGVLGTGNAVHISSAIEGAETPPEEWDEATKTNGWLRVYTYGTATYEDIFKRPFWTEFCLYYQWDAEGENVAATQSEQHNDAS